MGTHYRGNESEVRRLDSFIKLVRETELVSARVHRHLPEAGLTVSQFGVLETLHHLGPLTQRDVGRKVLKSSGNVTLVIDNLEKQGLVRRERSTEDRRFVAVHLTEAGRKLIEEIFPRHVSTIVAEMRTLSGREQDELGRLCKKLELEGVSAHHQRGGGGMEVS